MRFTRFVTILVMNILSVMLFISCYCSTEHRLWSRLDKSIFIFFNDAIDKNHGFALFVAITNYRGFDVVSLIAMGLLYWSIWRYETLQGRRRMLVIGITMFLTAIILNQLGHLLPVQHASPTLFIKNAHRVSKLTGISAKDSSINSFPGDHGMMLMIFSAFIWRYFSFRYFLISLAIMIVFALPRIMSGAHWFTDIGVGSLSIVLVSMSWWLLTPTSDRLVRWLNEKLPSVYKVYNK